LGRPREATGARLLYLEAESCRDSSQGVWAHTSQQDVEPIDAGGHQPPSTRWRIGHTTGLVAARLAVSASKGDRLLDHATILEINVESYRRKAALER